jgi:hypothetical protein
LLVVLCNCGCTGKGKFEMVLTLGGITVDVSTPLRGSFFSTRAPIQHDQKLVTIRFRNSKSASKMVFKRVFAYEADSQAEFTAEMPTSG